MTSGKRVVILTSVLAALFAFAAAPSLFARGGGGGGGGGGGRSGTDGDAGQPDDGSQPPPEDQPAGGSPNGASKGKDGTGGIDFGGDGVAQKDIAREVFAGMATDDFSRFRDERNRLASDPSSSRR